jgi:protein TonB
MKRLFFLNCFFFLAFILHAQVNPTKDPNKYSDKQNMDVVYTSEAHYKGDVQEMYKTIYKNLKLSEEAKNAHIRDTVIVSFDVNFDGKVQDIRVVKGVGYGIDEQIVKIISTLPFEPAIANGIPVRQNLMITIPIMLTE